MQCPGLLAYCQPMIADQFHRLVLGLNADRCRYLVVGGFAVIAHGFVRITGDIDLIPDLEQRSETERVVRSLERQGYRPRVPVPFIAYADPALRAEWRETKDMLVFSAFGGSGQPATIDLFLDLPFAFAPAWQDRKVIDVGNGCLAPFVDLERLLGMKRLAGRPKDLEDIRALGVIHDD